MEGSKESPSAIERPEHSTPFLQALTKVRATRRGRTQYAPTTYPLHAFVEGELPGEPALW